MLGSASRCDNVKTDNHFIMVRCVTILSLIACITKYHIGLTHYIAKFGQSVIPKLL